MTLSNKSISRFISIVLSIVTFFTIILSPLPTRKVFAETLNTENTETDLQNEEASAIETDELQATIPELAPLEPIEPDSIEALPDDPAENYLARVSEYVDENGFVTDEALESFTLPEAEEEQFYEIVENEDGSQEMKLYLQPIKYKDSNDEWADIDHSLILKETSAAQATTSTIAKKFETKAADVKISLSEDLSIENAIVYSYGDYEIGFSPQNIIKKDSVESEETVKLVEETVSQNSSNVSAFTAKDLESGSLIKNLDKAEFESLEYEKTFNEDASIKITPTYMGVKEEIILDSLPAETKFSYILNVDELVPLLREDGNLYFVDIETETIIATIAAPVMWDSAVEFKESYDIVVQLDPLGNNQYRYTLIPDREFLEANDTVYPVTIDPSINTTTSNIVDTFIASKISSKN